VSHFSSTSTEKRVPRQEVQRKTEPIPDKLTMTSDKLSTSGAVVTSFLGPFSPKTSSKRSTTNVHYHVRFLLLLVSKNKSYFTICSQPKKLSRINTSEAL
jgi:hypothetical protein